MAETDEDLERLKEFLDRDSGHEVERQQQLINQLWTGTSDQQLPEDTPSGQVTSLPPVKLFVGKIPHNLTKKGLRNWFGRYGDLVDVHLCTNYGFVTYYSREAAGRAICETNNRPPLNLSVSYCRKTETREQELQKKLQEICDVKPLNNDAELEDDWDMEIQKEKEMIASLDKFKEDYSSGDEEISVANVKRQSAVSEDKIEEKINVNDLTGNQAAKKAPCKRCGLESKFVCKGCSSERYCSVACQSLEWPLHRNRCNMKPESGDSSKQEIKVFAEIHKDNSFSPADVESTSRIMNKSFNELSTLSAIEDEKDRDLLTLRDQLQRAKIGENNSRQFLTNSDNSSSPPAEQSLAYFEKDLAESKIDWSEGTHARLLEIEGRWAMIRPISEVTRSQNLEKVLEDSTLTPLEEPAEGQVCLMRLGALPVRVVIDEISSNGRLGVHGLDQVHFESLSDITQLYHLPGKLVKIPAQCLTVRLAEAEGVTKDEIGKVFSIRAVGWKKCTPIVKFISLSEESLVRTEADGVHSPNCLTTKEQETRTTMNMMEKKDLETNSSVDSSHFIVPLQTGHHKCPTTRQYPPTNNSQQKVTVCTPKECPSKSDQNLNKHEEQVKETQDKRNGVTTSACNSNHRSESKTSSLITENDSLSLTIGSVQKVYVVHYVSPADFYVTTCLETLRDLQKKLYKIGRNSDIDPDLLVSEGDMVLARGSDKFWYRAVIKETGGEKVTIFCPDFGFSETVKMKYIREVDPRTMFESIKYLACHCTLMDWRRGSMVPSKDEIKEIRKRLPISASPIDINVLDVEEDRFVVDAKFIVRG